MWCKSKSTTSITIKIWCKNETNEIESAEVGFIVKASLPVWDLTHAAWRHQLSALSSFCRRRKFFLFHEFSVSSSKRPPTNHLFPRGTGRETRTEPSRAESTRVACVMRAWICPCGFCCFSRGAAGGSVGVVSGPGISACGSGSSVGVQTKLKDTSRLSWSSHGLFCKD